MSIIFLNDEFVDGDAPLISHRDCGFTTGIGIFDSMLIEDGNPVNIKEHYERIIHDAQTTMGFTPSLTFKKFKNSICVLLQENNLEVGYARARTTITGGIVGAPLAKPVDPTIIIDVAACLRPPMDVPMTCAIITDYPRISGCVLENCKRLDYMRSFAARRAAEALGAEEAILTNTDGNIACGATSNIFILEDEGNWVTPPLSDGVLAGVTRRKLLEERDIVEESISIERLKKAGDIYLTNSFIGLRKITLI